MSVGRIFAEVKAVDDSDSWTAIASTPTVDREGESIVPGAFNPLPKSVRCRRRADPGSERESLRDGECGRGSLDAGQRLVRALRQRVRLPPRQRRGPMINGTRTPTTSACASAPTVGRGVICASPTWPYTGIHANPTEPGRSCSQPSLTVRMSSEVN